MEIHPSKRHVISITKKAKLIIFKYQIHDHFQEQVHCAKYLSICVESKLTLIADVDVKAWATATMPKLNDNKTELMLVSSKRNKHLHSLLQPVSTMLKFPSISQ